MLWPATPTKGLRVHLFGLLSNEEPDLTVHEWHQYKFELGPQYLPQKEIKKIDDSASNIVSTWDFPALFPVRAILIQGHADYDLRRHGKDREDFEMNISRQRATQVADRLRQQIAIRIKTVEQESAAVIMAWQEEGLGSHRRTVVKPRSEHERSLNRRVEVFFARGAGPPFLVHHMQCPHFGTVTRGKFAVGYPSVRDKWTVEDCPNILIPSGLPSPCVRVEWSFVDGDIIDFTSQGNCISANGVNQGPVVMNF
jgi:hypothetical protein